MGIIKIAMDRPYTFNFWGSSCAEPGVQIDKTYYLAEGFETVTASCPVPILMVSRKKLPESESLTIAYDAHSRRRRR